MALEDVQLAHVVSVSDEVLTEEPERSDLAGRKLG